jgi:hypothetical protein
VTGDWIIYMRISAVNYYLTLGRRVEPNDAVIDRVRSRFDEFPELRRRLGSAIWQ